MKKFLPIAIAAVMSISAVAASAVSANAVEPLNTPVQYAQVAKASLATPKISKGESVYGGVKLTWGKVNGAAKYRVYRKGTNGWTKLADTTSTTYTDKTVSSGKSYTYTLRCISADGKSFTSGYDSKGTTVKYVAAPAISKIENVNGGVKVTWGKVSGASKYRVYRKNGSGWTKLTDTTSTAYTDKTASSGKSYTYTVRCISSDGKSFTSGYSSSGKSIKYIATPKISKAEVTYDGIKLTWNKVAGAEKYRLYYKDRNGWTKLIDTTGTSFIDMGFVSKEISLNNIGDYKTIYTVRCISKDGKSFTSSYDSKGVSVYTDDTVCPEIYGVSTASNGIELYWDDVCDGDSKYRVYVKENGSWKKIAETYDTYYLHKGVKAGKSYTYTVRGVSPDGKKFTTLYNPSGVTFKYKTTDKTRDAYIDYMLKHQDEWMPEKVAGYYALAGVEFVDLDFDGVPELIAQEAGDDGQNLDAKVYTFKNGKLQLVENDEIYIQNALAFYYNKSSKKYEIHGMGMINALYDAGLVYMTNYQLDYNGTKVAMKPYSSQLIQLPDLDEYDDLMYVYFNGSSDVITRLKYNEINMSKIGNCVNAHMHSQFVCTYSDDDEDIWGYMSNSERKQALLDSYNAFSYDRY